MHIIRFKVPVIKRHCRTQLHFTHYDNTWIVTKGSEAVLGTKTTKTLMEGRLLESLFTVLHGISLGTTAVSYRALKCR